MNTVSSALAMHLSDSNISTRSNDWANVPSFSNVYAKSIKFILVLFRGVTGRVN